MIVLLIIAPFVLVIAGAFYCDNFECYYPAYLTRQQCLCWRCRRHMREALPQARAVRR